MCRSPSAESILSAVEGLRINSVEGGAKEEEWNYGMMESCRSGHRPAFHYSNIPVFGFVTSMTKEIEKSLLDLDFAELTRRKFTPSPAAWEDQVLYFLLVDRFSDGNESGGHRDNDGRPVTAGTTRLFMAGDAGRVDYDTWLKAGGTWQGGTLKGPQSQIRSLER